MGGWLGTFGHYWRFNGSCRPPNKWLICRFIDTRSSTRLSGHFLTPSETMDIVVHRTSGHLITGSGIRGWGREIGTVLLCTRSTKVSWEHNKTLIQ